MDPFGKRLSLVLVGDSLLQRGLGNDGLVTLLSNYYVRKADVICRGYSGYGSSTMKLVLQKQRAAGLIDWRPPKLFVLWLGANDAALRQLNPQQHVPLHEFKENLREIVRLLDGPVLFITPPPVDGEKYDNFCSSLGNKPGARTLAVTKTYAEAVCELGNELQSPVLDVFSELMHSFADGAWKELLQDGLHLNDKGYQFIYQKIIEVIDVKFPQFSPKNLRLDAPVWRELDTSADLEECWQNANPYSSV